MHHPTPTPAVREWCTQASAGDATITIHGLDRQARAEIRGLMRSPGTCSAISRRVIVGWRASG